MNYKEFHLLELLEIRRKDPFDVTVHIIDLMKNTILHRNLPPHDTGEPSTNSEPHRRHAMYSSVPLTNSCMNNNKILNPIGVHASTNNST